VLGFPKCGGDTACPVHVRWGKIREVIREMLTSETVAHLMTPSKNRFDRLIEKAMEKNDTSIQRS
jgi:DNA-binding IscR family transcriptional regulator